MKSKLLVAGLIMLLACTAKKPIVVSQSDVERGAQKYPGYTLADLNAGKSLYEGHCGNCHGLKDPASRNEAQWKHEVAVMAPQANRKAGSEVIGSKEQELIVKYLVTVGLSRQTQK